jgi:hypothetical protein
VAEICDWNTLMDATAFVIALALSALLFACFGAWIAAAKGRSKTEGLILGLLFGPLGCLIEALLPAEERQGRPSSARSRRRSGYDFQEDVEDAEEARAAHYLGLLPKPDPQPAGLDGIRFDNDLRK